MLSKEFKNRVDRIQNKQILLTEAHIIVRIIKDDLRQGYNKNIEENIEKLLYIIESIKHKIE